MKTNEEKSALATRAVELSYEATRQDASNYVYSSYNNCRKNELIDELLNQLSEFASRVDMGLPIGNDDDIIEMRKIVSEWLKKVGNNASIS